MSMGFVCLMGMGTVFVGLICIIILCSLFSAIVRGTQKKEKAAPVAAPEKPVKDEPIPDRQQMIAAVCAAVAEELGTDVSALRVVSFRKL